MQRVGRSGLTIETSAISRFSGSALSPSEGLTTTDKSRLFRVIDYLVDMWKCAHAVEAAGPQRYAAVFMNFCDGRIVLSGLKHFAEAMGPWLRDVRVEWPQGAGSEAATASDGLQVRVEIVREGHEHEDAVQEFQVGVGKEIRLREFMEESVDVRSRPRDWETAMDLLPRLAHLLYNRQEFVPPYQVAVFIHPNKNAYSFVVSQMDYVDYAYLVACSRLVRVNAVYAYQESRRFVMRFTTAAPLEWQALDAAVVGPVAVNGERELKYRRVEENLGI